MARRRAIVAACSGSGKLALTTCVEHNMACALRAAPCSNGNISLMINLARRNGFPWDAILGAELARDYKAKPIVYRAAIAAMDCPPDE